MHMRRNLFWEKRFEEADMLKWFRSVSQLDFRQLMDVYEETNQFTGSQDYPREPKNLQILFAEQDFYAFLYTLVISIIWYYWLLINITL